MQFRKSGRRWEQMLSKEQTVALGDTDIEEEMAPDGPMASGADARRMSDYFTPAKNKHSSI